MSIAALSQLQPHPGAVLPLATSELDSRRCHAARPEAEVRAFALVCAAVAESHDGVLQRLAESALALCDAGSAGISVEEHDADGTAYFRWRAVAGRFAPYLGGIMPRSFSPCGVVLDTGALQLMTEPVRYYTFIAEFPHIVEVLLVPVAEGRHAIGTLWVVAHDDQRKFDAEDARTLQRLARFAAAALPVAPSSR